jgi:hypothetical protein
VVWMRCVSESLRSLSANMRLRGRDNRHLLDLSLLLPHGPHIRPMADLPPSLPHPSLCRGIDQSPPLRPKILSGTSSPSRPACDFAVLSPCPVLTIALSLLWFFSSLYLSLSRVWVVGVRLAVVLFYNPALFVLRLICPPPPPLFYAGRRSPPTSFISHRLYPPQSLDLISVYVFLSSLPRCCVFGPSPLLLSLLSYVHIIPPPKFEPFRRVYFLPNFSSSPLFIFIP